MSPTPRRHEAGGRSERHHLAASERFARGLVSVGSRVVDVGFGAAAVPVPSPILSGRRASSRGLEEVRDARVAKHMEVPLLARDARLLPLSSTTNTTLR